MDIISLLENKAIKPLEKRIEIEEAIRLGILPIQEIQSLMDLIDDKKMALVFEAMEAITAKKPEMAGLEWLNFVQEYISSKSNDLKREASRIVGNIARLFPNYLEIAIQKLLANTNNDGTVIRWSSAYALGKIIPIPQYANSELFDVVSNLYEKEKDNGIKNQYLNGLKKARKIRQ